MTRICSAHTAAGTIWEVDAALRPEGKAGQLVRTLASHRVYYEKWAKTWEFQAMLKARPAAGDLALGAEFVERRRPVRLAGGRAGELRPDTQAMRRRVVAHIPARDAGRELKLGEGGLRDVEFSVQLLQLVHGRVDEWLRVAGHAAGPQGAGRRRLRGPRGRQDARAGLPLPARARAPDPALPPAPDPCAARGRGGPAPDRPVARLRRAGDRAALHLAARVAPRCGGCTSGCTTRRCSRRWPASRPASCGSPRAAAEDRLQALGYDDPAAALRHIAALSQGVTRQAGIQRQLLPAMLGWFAEAPNPDAGLFAFRQVSEALGNTPWYLRALRDEGAMAERLARILASSRYAVSLLTRAPQTVQMLASEARLQPRPLAEIRNEMLAAAGRQSEQRRRGRGGPCHPAP